MKRKMAFTTAAAIMLHLWGVSAPGGVTRCIAEASSFEDEATPIEEDDIKSIDQISGDTSFEDESTPIEEEDKKSIDQINGDTFFEDESTPIEQEDTKSIDQINRGISR